MLALMGDVQVLDTHHQVIDQVLRSTFTDIEDALQYFTAVHHQVDVMVTRDLTFTRLSSLLLPIMTPLKFIAKFLTDTSH